MTDPTPTAHQTPPPHTVFEDATALATGLLLVSLGLVLHAHAQILIGGTMGMALLTHYAAGVDLALAIGLFNLPFYGLALWQLGWRLTVQTIVAVTLLSVIVKVTPALIVIRTIDPVYASVAGGLLMGVGLLALFRHRISLGGINLLALYAQKRFGVSAGVVQFGVDALVLLAALSVIPADRVALSLLAAFTMNVVLALNHRPGRYVGAN